MLARGEAVDVEQVLDVLIDNALAYGAPPIAVRVETDGGTAITSVTDAGPGIAAEDLDSVTDRFYRGSGAAPGGSGLGLAIAREIAERHGGSLEVASGPAGTRVAIRLPLAD